MDVNKEIERADEYVMELCTPDKMTKSEAVDYLDGLISRLESAKEALTEEMEDEAQ